MRQKQLTLINNICTYSRQDTQKYFNKICTPSATLTKNYKKATSTTSYVCVQKRAGTQHFLQDCMCTQRRLRSACASAQSDQSLRRMFEGKASSQGVFRRTAMTKIGLRFRADRSESSLTAYAML